MQKKLIVLALAGLASSAAFAQTNVTIYGVVDVFYNYQSADNTATGDQSLSAINAGGLSGSRLGFKGEEALGNGLKAIFTYEFGTLDPTSNTSGMANQRQAFVGLSGNWGTVAAGKLQSVGYDWSVKYDTFAAAAFSPIGIATLGNGMSISGTNTSLSRVPNTVGYISPNWSGFSLKTHYSVGEQVEFDSSNINTKGTAQNIYGIGAYYDNGPISVGVVYHGLFDIGGTNNNTSALDQNEWGIGGSYDFKFMKLTASYQAASLDANNGTPDADREAWAIGVGVPIGGNGKINFAFSQALDDLKADIYGIDYEHSLSKRTTAYVGATYVDSRFARLQPNTLGGTSSAFGPSAAGATINPGADQAAYMVGAGLRHTF